MGCLAWRHLRHAHRAPPPNPYLDVPDRDVVTTTGKALTLMNPAYALRELQENFGHDFGIRSHITSLKPLNPHNAADAWEKEAMKRFGQGSKEVVEIQQVAGQPHLRVMHPLIVEPDCLSCHAQHGYKLGDSPGGIGADISLAPYLANEREKITTLTISHGLIWLIGLLGSGISYRRERYLNNERNQAETGLRESETRLKDALAKLNRFAEALDDIPSYIYMKDQGRQYTYANKVTLNLFKCTAEELTGTDDTHYFPPETVAKLKAIDQRVLEHGETTIEEIDISPENSNRHVYLEVKHPIYDDEGKICGLCGISTDITERKQVETELRIAATAFEAQDGMIVTDANGVILRVNRAFTEITGYTAEEVVGQTPRLLKSGRQDAAFYDAMWKDVQLTGSWHGEIWNRRKNGEVYPEQLTITAVKENTSVITHYVGTLRDITARKEAEEKINNLAFYDTLTQLPNRRLLNDRLGQIIAASKRSGLHGALLFIDLDNFKPLNDEYGHDVGDLLLKEAAYRLASCVREVDTVARFGGDEFVVMLTELDSDIAESTIQAGIVAEKIRTNLAEPYRLEIQHAGHTKKTVEHHCTSSIGVVLISNQEISAEDIIKHADIAMYQAKNAGRNSIHFFNADDLTATSI